MPQEIILARVDAEYKLSAALSLGEKSLVKSPIADSKTKRKYDELSKDEAVPDEVPKKKIKLTLEPDEIIVSDLQTSTAVLMSKLNATTSTITNFVDMTVPSAETSPPSAESSTAVPPVIFVMPRSPI